MSATRKRPTWRNDVQQALEEVKLARDYLGRTWCSEWTVALETAQALLEKALTR